jgi:hypothetical protein
MLRCNDIDGIMNEMNNAMDMMHKMKDSCEKGYTPIMNEMLEEMIADKMSICIEKMMPEIQKENRTKFVLKLIGELIDHAWTDMNSMEKEEFLADVIQVAEKANYEKIKKS